MTLLEITFEWMRRSVS